METRSAKRRKLMDSTLETDRRRRDIDHISDLPDDVLHRILGLLPLKTIARTSILSKRWSQIWHSFPDLDFTTVKPNTDHQLHLDNLVRTNSKRFRIDSKRARNLLFLYDRDRADQRDFISEVLSLRHKQSNLRVLRFHAYVSLTCLNNLIRRALRFNVCELDVEFATDGSFNMPKRVISSESLRVLRFRSQFPGFRLPPLDALKCGSRSLQVMVLSFVIVDNKQPCLTGVFTDTSFPALKKLSLADCSGLKRIDVRCSGLEELLVENCYQLELFDVVASRLERLRVVSCFHICNRESSVKVNAPRLRVLEWERNGVTENSQLNNLTALDEAHVDFVKCHTDIPALVLRSASFFLLGLAHVRCLKLDSQCIRILGDRNFGSLLPFNNLGSLEVRTFFSRSSIPTLALLFRSCPFLHTFLLTIFNHSDYERKQWNRDLWRSSCSEEEKYWETQTSGMKSFLQHLKVVKIYGFLECEDEVSLAKFLLKHGKAMEEMTLCSGQRHGRDSLHRDKIRSQMMGFSRAASSAKISFQ